MSLEVDAPFSARRKRKELLVQTHIHEGCRHVTNSSRNPLCIIICFEMRLEQFDSASFRSSKTSVSRS